MRLLSIETSCDETAAAVVQNGWTVLSSVIGTQFEYHRPFKGVVPELASRAHVNLINNVIDEALKKAKTKPADLDGIVVTVGPGLSGALLVGIMTARMLGFAWKIPVYGANHIEGHLLSPLVGLKGEKPPFLGLVVSGGHTDLIYVKSWHQFSLLGRSRDDAAGEAFDKVATMLDLGFPGGPQVELLARKGDASREPFPRAWLPGTWDFSFSGLKTAVRYRLKEKSLWSRKQKANICAGFQASVVDVLVQKSMAAAKALRVKTIVVGGGVIANEALRHRFQEDAKKGGLSLRLAPRWLSTDNAAMMAAAVELKVKNRRSRRPLSLTPQPNLQLPPFKGSLPLFRIPIEN